MRYAPFLTFAITTAALGWGTHGHRMVTHLAIDAFEETSPVWLHTETARDRIAYQSNEPDRWKGTPTPAINHVNRPDHFIDIEHLALMDMPFADLPLLRREYIKDITLARANNPAATPATYDAKADTTKIYEFPGFLPYAILEHYEKLRASFQTIRILETLNDPTRTEHLVQARSNALYHMGMLSHFVGDASQPLHTTEHFNGWASDNPDNYTAERTFHFDIDTGTINQLDITLATLASHQAATIKLDPANPWPTILNYLNDSFKIVEPLYALEKLGALDTEPGKAFLNAPLTAAADMLAALYAAAWNITEPTEDQIAAFLRYGEHRPEGD